MAVLGVYIVELCLVVQTLQVEVVVERESQTLGPMTTCTVITKEVLVGALLDARLFGLDRHDDLLRLDEGNRQVTPKNYLICPTMASICLRTRTGSSARSATDVRRVIPRYTLTFGIRAATAAAAAAISTPG